MISDAKRLQHFLQKHGLTGDQVAALWGGSADDVKAVLSGDAAMTGRHRALLVLFGSAHKDAKASALAHLLEAGEAWRPIPGFGNYEASSEGRVRRRYGGSGASPLRVLKQTPYPNGYLRVTLYDDAGRMRTKAVHRIVCLAFHGESELLACHRDGDRRRNRPDNLYWGTPADNAADRVRHDAEAPQRREVRLGEITGSKIGKARARKLALSGKINKAKALEMMGLAPSPE